MPYTGVQVLKGKLLKVRAVFQEHVFVFVCVYAPTNAEESFLNALLGTLLCCNAEEFLVVGGDFVCTEQDLDRNHSEPYMVSYMHLKRCQRVSELCDVWRAFYDVQRQYNWTHAYNSFLSLASFDRYYLLRHQRKNFKSCSISPVIFPTTA